jgi:hypothetical protein
MNAAGDSGFPWRAVILGPLTVTLLGLALYFYNNLRPEIGLTVLGVTFAVPMVWVTLAARDASHADTPLRGFIPRLTGMIILGTAYLGATMWRINPTITAIEAGFAVFYIGAALTALHILNGKPRRPQLTALSGGSTVPRERRRGR